MARNKGTFNFAANFQVKMQEALDPRVVVSAKADLINKETWPYDGDTIYLYEGLIVGVAAEKSAYMLIDAANITAEDYSGWKRIDAGASEQVEVIDNLESDSATAALSAAQGKVLMNNITTLEGKLAGVYTYKGSVADYDSLPTEGLTAGDVYNVEAAYGDNTAGTNYAWTGSEWDALAGIIDLSAYYTSEQVDAAIKVEADRAAEKEAELLVLIENNAAAAKSAQDAADANTVTLSSVTQNIGEINEDLVELSEKNDAQDTRLTNLEKLVSGGEAGDSGSTLLEMVNENAAAILQLQTDVKDLQTQVSTNTSDIESLKSQVGESTVSEQIDEALSWEDVE